MVIKKQPNLLTKAFSFVLLGSIALTNVGAIQTLADNSNKTSVKSSVMKKYTTDLTGLASAGRIGGNTRYEKEVNSLIKMLTNGDLRQPVILDEKGDNQELVIETLAARIAAGDVPASLKNKRVLKLELDAIFTSSMSAAEKSQAFAGVVSELAASKSETILFVDEISNFVGANKINDSLTDALLQGKVNIIGGSSKAAYDAAVENNAEVSAVFQTLTVDLSNGNSTETAVNASADRDGYRGDNVSSDIREMMSNDTTGKKRIDVLIQAKNADNQTFRAIMAEKQCSPSGSHRRLEHDFG